MVVLLVVMIVPNVIGEIVVMLVIDLVDVVFVMPSKKVNAPVVMNVVSLMKLNKIK
jgi:hypothetical protein